MLSLHCCVRAFSSCGKWELLSGCSNMLLLLQSMGSRAPGLQQLQHMGPAAPGDVESPQTRDGTCIPHVGRWIPNHWTTREVQISGFPWSVTRVGHIKPAFPKSNNGWKLGRSCLLQVGYGISSFPHFTHFIHLYFLPDPEGTWFFDPAYCCIASICVHVCAFVCVCVCLHACTYQSWGRAWIGGYLLGISWDSEMFKKIEEGFSNASGCALR